MGYKYYRETKKKGSDRTIKKKGESGDKGASEVFPNEVVNVFRGRRGDDGMEHPVLEKLG